MSFAVPTKQLFVEAISQNPLWSVFPPILSLHLSGPWRELWNVASPGLDGDGYLTVVIARFGSKSSCPNPGKLQFLVLNPYHICLCWRETNLQQGLIGVWPTNRDDWNSRIGWTTNQLNITPWRLSCVIPKKKVNIKWAYSSLVKRKKNSTSTT